MGQKLQADDFQVEMLVTVLQYHDIRQQRVDGPDVEVWTRNPASLGVGVPMKIVHVELPFSWSSTTGIGQPSTRASAT